MTELKVFTGTPVVIDTSVAFKWFDRTEPDSDVADELLASHQRGDITLMAPVLLRAEILNALACRGTGIAVLERALRSLTAADLLLAPLDEWMLLSAARVSAEERIALYDATFVALAERIEAQLVTADRKQARTQRCGVRLIG